MSKNGMLIRFQVSGHVRGDMLNLYSVISGKTLTYYNLIFRNRATLPGKDAPSFPGFILREQNPRVFGNDPQSEDSSPFCPPNNLHREL
jgi:hypothetical protein